jgi:hypothetical protein
MFPIAPGFIGAGGLGIHWTSFTWKHGVALFAVVGGLTGFGMWYVNNPPKYPEAARGIGSLKLASVKLHASLDGETGKTPEQRAQTPRETAILALNDAAGAFASIAREANAEEDKRVREACASAVDELRSVLALLIGFEQARSEGAAQNVATSLRDVLAADPAMAGRVSATAFATELRRERVDLPSAIRAYDADRDAIDGACSAAVDALLAKLRGAGLDAR